MKKYYKDISIIRLLACITVFLYHLNILKGGYLAVCIFFVLSAYLSCISAFKQKKFSIKEYYIKIISKIYLPLVIIVFTTIFIVSLFQNINWLNLKPETTSVLLGYNNFWQLSSNLDYFTRNIDSPFIHLWYISILLQFDLIFPFIYILLRKVGDKIHKILPCIITGILSIISFIYFSKINLNQNIMISYYDTFARMFSLFLGLCLAFIKSYYGSLVPKSLRKTRSVKKQRIKRRIFYFYIFILIILFIFVDSKSIFFIISMILVSLISCRLIDYATLASNRKLSIFDRNVKFLSNISYEIYLIQYPVIYLFQYVNISYILKIPIIIIIVIVLSFIFNYSFDLKNKKPFKYVICIIILIASSCGIYKYVLSVDHTKEMEELKKQLLQNEEILKQKQEEYVLYIKQENEDWMKTLQNIENGEKELQNIVTNLPITAIGDSIMLGAVDELYKKFPNGYFDAEVSRSIWKAKEILNDLKNKNMLSDTIIINLGANGDCTETCKKEILDICENREVFWVNVTNDDDVNINDKLNALSSLYNNLHIIDWNFISNGHSEYFVSDGIHLTSIGMKAYSNAVYDAVYDVYLKKYQEQTKEIIDKHEQEINEKISFYGNDILLNSFEYIHTDFSNAKFVIDKEYNYESLKQKITDAILNNSLNHRIVFAFDNSFNMSIYEYKELIELCKDYEVYILSVNDKINLSSLDYENVTIIDFYNEIKNNDNYLMADKIHLTEEGNVLLKKILNDALNN